MELQSAADYISRNNGNSRTVSTAVSKGKEMILPAKPSDLKLMHKTGDDDAATQETVFECITLFFIHCLNDLSLFPVLTVVAS